MDYQTPNRMSKGRSIPIIIFIPDSNPTNYLSDVKMFVGVRLVYTNCMKIFRGKSSIGLICIVLLFVLMAPDLNAGVDANFQSNILENTNRSLPQPYVKPGENLGQPSNIIATTNSVLEWPQVQRDPQRSGYSPAMLGSELNVEWTHPFQPEKIYPQVQAIVYDGKVFIGTEMGTMYALDAHNGNQVWSYKVASLNFPGGAPILNSVAAGDGRVYFGAMDGAVYALNTADGHLLWRTPISQRLGFSTAPVLADDKVMLGGRDGIFYALNPISGAIVWQYFIGSPILQTAAWDNGRIFFGSMNMQVYALNTTNGTLAWQSQKIRGMAFKDYWPVIYQGKIFIRPMAKDIWYGVSYLSSPFIWFAGSSGSDWNWLITNGATIAAGQLTQVAKAMQSQNDFLAAVQANPNIYPKNFYILDENTGQEAYTVPQWGIQTMNGATPPPCIDRDGKMIVPIYFVNSGWGRLDLATRKITDVLYDNRDTAGNPMSPGHIPAGMGNPDETQNVTCVGNSVISMHTEEGNAAYTGFFNLDKRMWTIVNPGQTNQQMSTNTQGGGGNPASVYVDANSNVYVFHISWNELIARKAIN
jgi:outer membrane protein assembly factor BamB